MKTLEWSFNQCVKGWCFNAVICAVMAMHPGGLETARKVKWEMLVPYVAPAAIYLILFHEY